MFQPLACKERMPAAWYFVASVCVVIIMYVCHQWLCLSDLWHDQAHVFTSISLGGGCACYGFISAQVTNLKVINKMNICA